MHLLLLGRGKTGSLVAQVAHERRHHVRILGAADNTNARALTPDFLSDVDVVIDFTGPFAVVPNIEACVSAGKNMVVGSTGWHEELSRVREMVNRAGTGFLFGTNFSIGVNIFFEIARSAAAALNYDYAGQIFERHHAHKKDAPSGTAMTLQKLLREVGGRELEIVSFREGEVLGMHEVVLNSANDRIYLCHDSNSRRGFAEGAVRAAEWLAGKHGFFDFREIWKDL
jgi:4-hydroxy-tetrahydrodipicolinate reductase